MTIKTETALKDFQFWSGACDRTNVLTSDDFDTIENELEAMNPDGMTDTEINDLFWFEEDYIAQMLGYDSFEELEEARNAE